MKNTTWKIPLIILAAIIAIALSCVFMVQGSQNHAISLEEQVGESKAAINAQEKRRQDLVYNLADSVKAYDKHEADTLKDIVKERSSNTGKIRKHWYSDCSGKRSLSRIKVGQELSATYERVGGNGE